MEFMNIKDFSNPLFLIAFVVFIYPEASMDAKDDMKIFNPHLLNLLLQTLVKKKLWCDRPMVFSKKTHWAIYLPNICNLRW